MILVDGKPVAADYGGCTCTTNNLMELEAAIQGLQAVERRPDLMSRNVPIVVVSDSQYTLGIANGEYTPTKNLESAQKLRELTKKLCAGTRWVKGHAKNVWNNRCDSLAKRGKEENTPPGRLAKQRAKKAKK